MRVARRRLACAALVLATLGAHPAAALDASGKWLLNTGQYADFVQSGTSLAITLFGNTLTGTIDPDGSFVTFGFLPGCEFALGGSIIGGKRLVGSSAALCAGVTESVVSGVRCECLDGNGTGGDGCDPRCQIEPCFACSGDPSVCVPSGDGAACDDRNACTSGETCSGGACGGGSPVSPCLDLSGQWLEQVSVPGFDAEYGIVDVTQVGTLLEFGGSPTSLPLSFGTIDPATGAMEKGAGVGYAFCSPADVATGTAALDGDAYALSGLRYVPQPDLFCDTFPATITGTRCVGPCVLPTTTTTTTTTTSTSTTTTTAPLLLSAKKLVLKDHLDPARRRLSLGSKDVPASLGGGNGSSDDPTLAGATLRVRTTAGCGGPCDATYLLPAEGWQLAGNPGAHEGYKYSDRLLVAGPVRIVSVKPGKSLRVVAKGAQLAHQLASNPQPVEVVLTLGAQQSCFRSGGTTAFRAGREFRASNMPRPVACP